MPTLQELIQQTRIDNEASNLCPTATPEQVEEVRSEFVTDVIKKIPNEILKRDIQVGSEHKQIGLLRKELEGRNVEPYRIEFAVLAIQQVINARLSEQLQSRIESGSGVSTRIIS